MYTKTIECGVSLALAEYSDARISVVINLNVDLSTLSIVLRLDPDFLRPAKGV